MSGPRLQASALCGGLDLDYRLEGTFRQTEDKIRITIRLIDLRRLSEISWTQRFDGDLKDILTLQDSIAASTAAQVAPELLLREAEPASVRPQIDPDSYGLMLRAIPAVYRLDQDGFRAAGPMLQEALSLNPGNAAAHSWLAHWYLLLLGQGWTTDSARAIESAHEHARRAVTLDPGDARGLTILGHAEAFLHKRPAQALRLHVRALDLNPNLALAWCYAGLAYSYMGRHAEAIEHIRRAQQLSPHDPHRFFFDTSMVMPLLLTGDYANAAQIGRRSQAANPALSSAYKGLLAALGHMGYTEEAYAMRRQLAELEPHFSVWEALERSPLIRPEDRQRYATGLRLAGVPERARTRALWPWRRSVLTPWRHSAWEKELAG